MSQTSQQSAVQLKPIKIQKIQKIYVEIDYLTSGNRLRSPKQTTSLTVCTLLGTSKQTMQV